MTIAAPTDNMNEAREQLERVARDLNTARDQLARAQHEFRASASSPTSDPYRTTELGTRIRPLGDRVQELEAAHRVALSALRVAQAQALADPPAA